ncbi:squalene/phytoene synthase family protein [Microvirga massiliensis]|uniref:squalene/phytoene synthase family protein n=1 Tax=Microvirga massiliensis TaxID=1033741 RepID=UPI00069A2327|nr:squalene/phytoene synthase family protein [Microvirga massiliensis]
MADRTRRPAKAHRDENFPVASRLIAPSLREPILAFYRFVRKADDIADDPALDPAEKLARLAALERSLLAADPAEPHAAHLAAVYERLGVGIPEAQRLLEAFRQDAAKSRYSDWADLLAYCERSAVPVGRFLLALHEEGADAAAPADALCTALQILNHLQDLGEDAARLDRIYLPQPWLARAGGEVIFLRPEAAPERRPVLDAALDQVDALLQEAACLPERLRSRRLAAESAVTITLAERLASRLRREDPLLRRISLGRIDVGLALAAAAVRIRYRQGAEARVARAIVRRSGSSFRLAIATLSGERRRAMNAIYAFCRVVDGIADSAAPPAEKIRFLHGWRRDIDALAHAPATALGRELAWACRHFALPCEEFHYVLDGMEADAVDRVRLADDPALDLYCRRVVGSVGLLSIAAFGVPQARDFALLLGRTLQIVNILRDVEEDARLDRVYIPLSRIGDGLASRPATDLLRDPRLVAACGDLAAEAQAGFAAADIMLARLDRRALKPAILMMEAYRCVLARLVKRGWSECTSRPHLGLPDRLRLMTLAARPA